MNNKLKGIIYGHALGDALGAPVEFFPFGHYTGLLDTPITRYTRNYGKQVSVVGQVTDDTELALTLFNTIKDGYTKEKAVVNYMLWANNKFEGCKGNVPWIGNNTRNLFIAPKPTYKLYENRFKKHYTTEESKEQSQSNGALMRCYPLAFVEDELIHWSTAKCFKFASLIWINFNRIDTLTRKKREPAMRKLLGDRYDDVF